MNRNLQVFFASALVLAVIGAVVFLQPGFAQTRTPTPGAEGAGVATMRTVSVSGTGMASAAPDTAVIVVGVQTDADTATAALNQNNQQMTALITALVGEGIVRTSIQTQSVSLYPRYSDQPQPEGATGQPVVSGYTASNTVEVRLTDITQVGEILDQAVQSGGNVIQNIRFEVSDQEDVLTQARESAVAAARQKAEQLAGLVDAQVGQVVAISESTYFPLPYASGGIERAAQDSAVPIEPGSQNVQVTVQVTWELTGTTGGQ